MPKFNRIELAIAGLTAFTAIYMLIQVIRFVRTPWV